MPERVAVFKYLKLITYATLVINATTIVLSLFGEFPISNIAGFMYLVAISVNLLAIFVNFLYINTADAKGKLLKIICYVYLVFLFFAMFLLLFKQILFVTQVDPNNSRLMLAEITHWVVYFGILGFAVLLTLLDLKYFHRPETWTK